MTGGIGAERESLNGGIRGSWWKKCSFGINYKRWIEFSQELVFREPVLKGIATEPKKKKITEAKPQILEL